MGMHEYDRGSGELVNISTNDGDNNKSRTDKLLELNELANDLKRRREMLKELNDSLIDIYSIVYKENTLGNSILGGIANNNGLACYEMIVSLMRGLEVEISEIEDQIAKADI